MVHYKAAVSTSALVIMLMATARAQATRAPDAPADGPASAQQPNADSGDIVVTAQKRSESINRVPLSIVAATGDQLVAQGIRTTADLTKIVTGFQATTSQVGAPIYYLRGVGYEDVSVAARPTVTLYNDEAPLAYASSAIGTSLDLERVEVLKGPQGLLFGSNSTGGAINFIAAKPTDTFHAGFDGSFGRFNQNTVSGFVSGPISGGIKGRIAVSHEGMGTWQYDYVDGDRLGHRNNWSGRATLVAEPSSNLTARLTLFGALDKSDPQAPQFSGFDAAVAAPAVRAYPVAPSDDRAASFSAVGFPGQSLRKNNYTWQPTLRLDYHVSDGVSVTSLTSYLRNRQRYVVEGDGTNLRIDDFAVQGVIKSFSQELRLSGDSGPIRWIVGGNYEHDSTDETITVNIADSSTGHVFSGPPFNFPPIQRVDATASQKFESEAAFANVEYSVTDKISLRGGLRYTRTSNDFAGCARQTDPSSSNGIFLAFGVPLSYRDPAACQTLSVSSILAGAARPTLFVSNLTQDNVSWRVGADFKPMPGTLTYVSVSRGFKAGAFSNLHATLDSQYVPVTQEQLTAYEVGIKTDIVPSRLHVNSALFYYDYNNKQVQGTTVDKIFGPLQSLVSIPKSRVWGAELEATVVPVTGLTLGAMGTYVDTKITKSFIGFSRFGVSSDFKGDQFANTPKWQLGANAEYRQAVSGTLNGFVNTNVTYRSHANGDFVADQRLDIRSYALVDGQVGVEAQTKAWKVALYGRNIFNKYYWTNVVRPGDAITRYTGMPATYGVQLSFRY